MRKIEIQPDAALAGVMEEWVAHLLVAIPVRARSQVRRRPEQRHRRQPSQAANLDGLVPAQPGPDGPGPLPQPARSRPRHHRAGPQRGKEQLNEGAKYVTLVETVVAEIDGWDDDLRVILPTAQNFRYRVLATNQALAIFRELGDRWGQGLALDTSARASMDLRRFEEAVTTCRQALSVHREIGDRTRRSRCPQHT